MTPQEQIAYLRKRHRFAADVQPIVLAVCDLAERALLDGDEAEAVRRDLQGFGGAAMTASTKAVLRRLLGEDANA